LRRLLLSCAGLVLAIWVLALAAPSDRARLPHGTDSEAPDSAAPDRTPPEVQEMAGEPSWPDPDPSDDRVRITAADGYNLNGEVAPWPAG